MASEASARAASAVLTDGGIDHRLLKGVAVAHADYPDSHVRTFVDADLLVRRADLTVAVAALKRAGLVRANPPVHDWWERRYARAVTMRTAAGFELDLHALLAVGYFGAALPEDPLWSEPADHIHLGGQTVAVLGPAGRLLHAGLNAVLRRDAGPRSLRDLAQLLLVTHAPLERAVQLARAGDAEPVLGEAIIRTWNAFALDPEHEAARWAGTVRPSPRAGRALKLADRPLDAGWAVDARSTLMALGPIDKVLFVAGVAAPSRASMRARGRSIDEHVARGFRVARWNRGA